MMLLFDNKISIKKIAKRGFSKTSVFGKATLDLQKNQPKSWFFLSLFQN